VLISFYENVRQEERNSVHDRLLNLGESCGGLGRGIIFWRAGWNLDQRKNFHLMELAVFSEAAALREFRTHPAHVSFSGDLANLADWVVGDIDLKFR
jgi:hypothetical protein